MELQEINEIMYEYVETIPENMDHDLAKFYASSHKKQSRIGKPILVASACILSFLVFFLGVFYYIRDAKFPSLDDFESSTIMQYSPNYNTIIASAQTTTATNFSNCIYNCDVEEFDNILLPTIKCTEISISKLDLENKTKGILLNLVPSHDSIRNIECYYFPSEYTVRELYGCKTDNTFHTESFDVYYAMTVSEDGYMFSFYFEHQNVRCYATAKMLSSISFSEFWQILFE